MAEALVGRAVIELVADGRRLAAGISEAKRSLRTLGEGQRDITRAQSASIDRYIGQLNAQAAGIGKSAAQSEILRLSMRGASNEQINAAAAALKLREASEKSFAVDKVISGLKQQNAEFGKSQSAIDLYRLKLQGASQEQLKSAGAALRLGESLAKGVASREASAAIDQTVKGFTNQAAVLGKTRRETELFALAQSGASKAQLAGADSALRAIEAHERQALVLSRLKTGLIAVGVAAGAAFVGKTIGTIDFLDSLHDLSKSTAITVEDLAGLSLLAKQTGTDMDGLAKGINKMSVEMGKAPEKFIELGITAKDPLGAFKQLADIFIALPDIQQRNALSTKVLGKSWAELAGAMSEGSRGIDEAVAKGKRLSGVNEEMTRKADEFKDKLAELQIAGAAFGANFIPHLTKIVEWLIKATGATKDFIASLPSFGGPDPITQVSDRIATAKRQLEAGTLNPAGANRSFFSFLIPDVKVGEQALGQIRSTISALEKEKARLTNSTLTTDENDRELRRLRGQQQSALNAANLRINPNAAAKAAKFLDEGKKKEKEPDTARQDAAAQLQFDLSQIKASSDAQLDAFRNAESIMQAMRSAQLVEDKDFYASKLSFIQIFGREDEAALQAQIKRREAEAETIRARGDKDATKDLLDNKREIAKLDAQIAKIQADTVTKSVILGVDQQAALKKIQQGYEDAKEAAEAYLETITRANAREIEGIGRGNRFRQDQAGLGAIDDKLLTERRRLEGEKRRGQIDQTQFDTYLARAQDTYSKEVEMYVARTAAIEDAQRDWLAGASEALENYIDQTRDVAKQFEEVFTNGFKSAEDALLNLTSGSIKSFKDLGDVVTKFFSGIALDLAKVEIRQNITGPLAEFLKENGRLEGLGGLLGLKRPGGIPAGATAVPVTESLLAKASIPGLTGGAEAANAAAFSTAVTASGTTFATAATTAGTTVAGELVAAGGTFAPASVTAATTLTTAATSFATIITTAATTFATTVASASTASGGAGLLGDIFGGLEFAGGGSVVGPGTGTSDSIPAMLSNREFVVNAAAATEPGAPTFLATLNDHGLAAALSALRKQSSLAVSQAAARSVSNVIPFARGGIVERPEYFALPAGATGLRGEAGPEAIMPLRRHESGVPGVIVAGGGTLPVTRDVSGNMAVRVPKPTESAVPWTRGKERHAPDWLWHTERRSVQPSLPKEVPSQRSGTGATNWRYTAQQPSISAFDGTRQVAAVAGLEPAAHFSSATHVPVPTPGVYQFHHTTAPGIVPDIPRTPAPLAPPALRLSVYPSVHADAATGAVAAPARILTLPGIERLTERIERSELATVRDIRSAVEPKRAAVAAMAVTASLLSGALAAAPVLPVAQSIAAPSSSLTNSLVNNIGGATTVNHAAPAHATMPAALPVPSSAPAVPYIGSFESGIRFVPQTGLALLHKGERVLNSEQNTENNRGGDTYNINVSFPAGADKKTVDYAVAEMERKMSMRRRGMS